MERLHAQTRPPLYVASPALAALCADEVRTRDPGALSPLGLVRGMPSAPVVDACFARQVLPRAQATAAATASALALELFRTLDDDAEEVLLSGRAALHVSWPEPSGPGSVRKAPPLMPEAQAVEAELAGKLRGRAQKRGIDVDADVAPTEVSHLWQVMVTGRFQAFSSWSERASDAADPLLAWPGPFPGGRAAVADRPAPSSAFRKLVEALAWLGRSPGKDDVVLDLGAAPGGWSYVALETGARVIAYDPAELDPRLSRHPRLEHRRQDAFRAPPFDEATWLVCDVIDKPSRALDLVARALLAPTLKGLVVTLKLPRPAPLPIVEEARALLAEAKAKRGVAGRVKHLVHNKHEVTLLARS